MDDEERKDNAKWALNSPLAPLMDLGTTLPWTLPSIIQESAIRSTQTSPQSTVNPLSLHKMSASEPTNVPPWTAPECPPLLKRPSQESKTIGKGTTMSLAPNLNDDEHAGDQEDDHTSDEDDDGVYMINAAPGSWSGSLSSEEDPGVRAKLPYQAEPALHHLKCAQKLAEEQQRRRVAAEQGAQDNGDAMELTSEDRHKWHRDLLLRNVMRQIKQKLKDGAVLLLERQGHIDIMVSCAHPDCPSAHVLIQPGAYYFTLGHAGQLTIGTSYCLSCLEGLWKGDGMAGQLPDPRIDAEPSKRRQIISNFSLDGALDDESLGVTGILPAVVNPGSSVRTNSTGSTASSLHTASTPATECNSSYDGEIVSPALSDISSDHLQADSPLTRKIKNLGSISSEAHAVGRGSGKACTKRFIHTVGTDPARRSARVDSEKRKGCVPHTSKSTQKSAIGAHEKPSRPSKSLTADAIEVEATKAEKKLEAMYKEREIAITLLEPGSFKVIRSSQSGRWVDKRCVRMDMFGMVYTDLLADHSKCWTKAATVDGQKYCGDIHQAVDGPASSNLGYQQTEHWCICRREEGGRKMIKCDNEKCLIGWHHMDCLATPLDETHDWLCPLCASQQASDGVMPPNTIDQAIVDKLCSSPYAQMFAERVYNIRELEPIMPQVLGAESEAMPILQLDGTTDSHHQPPKASPLSKTGFQISESLLSSRHASTADELPFSQVPQRRLRTPTPPLDDWPRTPGSPYSSEDSITSDGDWYESMWNIRLELQPDADSAALLSYRRHPVTRFQSLGEFIIPGDSLNSAQRAAVELWKAVSKDQSKWNDHRANYKNLIEELARDEDEDDGSYLPSGMSNPRNDSRVGETPGNDRDADAGETIREREGGKSKATIVQECNKDDEDEADGHWEWLEAKSGLSKKKCHGKDLTEVLAEFH